MTKSQRKYAHLTWDFVLEILENRSPGFEGITNRQLADQFGFDAVDVSNLTRIMWKAGAIDRREGKHPNHSMVLFYFKKEKT